MSARPLEQPTERDEQILSCPGVAEEVRDEARQKLQRTTQRMYTIPFPHKDYATIELDYRGNFSDAKEHGQYELDMLGWN